MVFSNCVTHRNNSESGLNLTQEEHVVSEYTQGFCLPVVQLRLCVDTVAKFHLTIELYLLVSINFSRNAVICPKTQLENGIIFALSSWELLNPSIWTELVPGRPSEPTEPSNVRSGEEDSVRM